MWIAADFPQDPETPGGAEFFAQLAAFSAANPGVEVDVRVKNMSGAGGIVDTLHTAGAAAPGALPDLIAVDIQTLITAARDDLLVPLDDLTSPESTADFFPASIEPARIDEQLMGLPFASNAEVLVYSTELFASPPVTWSDILQGGGVFLFPAADPAALATLHQYIALGGELADESGSPALDEVRLQAVFDLYVETRAAGLVEARSLSLTTSDEAWAAYAELRAPLAVTDAHTYLSRRQLVAATGATVLPTRDGNRLALTETWYYALARTDAERQPLAQALLNWLVAPENLAAWTLQAGYLPPRAAAIAAWPEGAPAAFAAEVQAAARPRPDAQLLATLGSPVNVGVDRILRGLTTPPAAAEAVVAALETP